MRTVNPQRHAARRADILAAAACVFAERGYERTTTAAICRAAGIGSGTLFHYFPDKRSIFHALFADDLATTEDLIRDLDASDPLAAIFAIVDHRVADAGDPIVPGLLVAAIGQAGNDAEFAALLEEDERLLVNATARLVRAAQTRGMVDSELDPTTAARWIVALIDALYFQAGGPAFDAAADTDTLRLILHRYLGVTPA